MTNHRADPEIFKRGMNRLNPEDALTFPGSLLTSDGAIVASYDFEHLAELQDAYQPALTDSRILNANAKRFRLDYRSISRLHVINGMGVTLGDSIIGLSAIAAVRANCPRLAVSIYRPSRAPGYVEELYSLAAGVVFDERVFLPWRSEHVHATEILVDVGNHLFWRDFATEPMIDFFCDALGMEPGDVASSHKANRWLAGLTLPALSSRWDGHGYALFCPDASTPIRSIPPKARARLVDIVFRKYGLPVLGFGHVDHPQYSDIAAYAPTTAAFLAWFKNAKYVMACDSAAVHAASGFDVPTTAFFSSIPAELRARDYAKCHAVNLRVREIDGLQASSRQSDIAALEQRFERLTPAEIPLPHI